MATHDQRNGSIRWLVQVTIVLCGAGLFFAMFFGNLYFKNLSARTMVYLTPMLMIVCGYGLSLIEQRPRQLLTATLVVVSLSTVDFVQPRLDSNVAAQALAAEYTPGDLIILEDGWMITPSVTRYAGFARWRTGKHYPYPAVGQQSLPESTRRTAGRRRDQSSSAGVGR